MTIIDRDRSVIPACDVASMERYENIVESTHDMEGIGGYKVGFSLGLRHGLPAVVDTARRYTEKPVIYDHQKAGTDIPYTADEFMDVCSDAGVDAVILFPQAGPETEEAWIDAATSHGLDVIVGGLMTHDAYTRGDGGFIADEAVEDMYRIAAEEHVSDFVVPGNQPGDVAEIKDLLEEETVDPVFYAPGFVAQGGEISDAAAVAGDQWHAIVGRGIYQASDMRRAAEALTESV